MELARLAQDQNAAGETDLASATLKQAKQMLGIN